jgi:ribosomal protein S18 acetylase RimI-like enzyme
MEPTKSSLKIRAFELPDEAAVMELWQQCKLTRPWNDPKKDIQRKLTVQPHLFLVGILEQQVVSSIMAGYEGHRGWINYLAVAPEYQRQGIGRAMMVAVEQLLHDTGCPKINIQVRSSNQDVLQFYKTLGYLPDEAICLGKRLEVDSQTSQ